VMLAAFIAAGSAAAKVPHAYKNCTVVNERYAHGIGRVDAHDHTSGTPVTNFKRSNGLFAAALHWNRGLDRDHDGIACEEP
jgi:hypothetical protein